jgi:hypothetical protein
VVVRCCVGRVLGVGVRGVRLGAVVVVRGGVSSV